MTPLLDVKGLSVDVVSNGRRLRIVRDIDLQVAAGETLCVVGESGCGKSMTALGLMGLLPAGAERRAGRLTLDDLDLASLSRHALEDVRGDRMAMVFQDPNTAFNPTFTIGDQLEESWRRHRPGGRATARARALSLLERVGIASPERRLRQYPHQLSGGLRQRVMIAMALMCSPRLLVADEPTTALDVTIQAQVLRLMRALQRELGLGILLITHDIGVVAAMATRLAVMYAGEIVEMGPAGEVLADPRHPYTRGLLACFPDAASRGRRLGTIPGTVPSPADAATGCQFAGRCPLAVDACRAGPIALETDETGRAVRCLRWRETRIPLLSAQGRPEVMAQSVARLAGEPIVETSGLERDFQVSRGLFASNARLRALRGVSLRLYPNETVAIVGESGCGKSTLARIVLGLQAPTSGDVYLAGEPVGRLSRMDTARLVQPVFQDPYASLAPHRRILDTVMVPLQVLGVGSKTEQRAWALDMLERVGLPRDMAHRLPFELSGGQRQRVAIARALVLHPPILVCDEPTSALDVSVQAQILNLLLDLKREFGLSLLLITHNLAVVGQIADRVAVMYLGGLVEEGAIDDVLRHPRHPYTRLLLSSALSPSLPIGGLSDDETDGHFPDPLDPPPGCAFHPRCPRASEICRTNDPSAAPLRRGFVACHHPLANEAAPLPPHKRTPECQSLTN
jgi:peptide/nickel transport system ATP-binding protein